MTRRRPRVLVVDDSPFIRRFLREVLEAEPIGAEVDGAANGRTALQKALQCPPELVTLDLEMPVLDGFSFLRLFRSRSAAPVLVVTSLSDLGVVERGLELGANGFITKPTDPYHHIDSIAQEVRLKVAQVLRSRLASQGASPANGPDLQPVRGVRDPPPAPVIVIGSSSGGPPSLQYLLSGLPPSPRASVLIAQHMPEGFTAAFAERLNSLLPVPVREARGGDLVQAGRVLVAPGGNNSTVRSGTGGAVVSIEAPDGAEYGTPSVDRLFTTAAETIGARLTAVVLTGMGRDGADGVRAVKAAGGRVLVESEQTAAVYGMPREAASTGCVDRVIGLPEIAVEVLRLAQG